jgi:hypothetical protein
VRKTEIENLILCRWPFVSNSPVHNTVLYYCWMWYIFFSSGLTSCSSISFLNQYETHLWDHYSSLIHFNTRRMTFQLNYWNLLYLCVCVHYLAYTSSLVHFDPHFQSHCRNCNFSSPISHLSETDLLKLNKGN